MKPKRLDDLIKEIERTLIPISNKQRRCFYEEKCKEWQLVKEVVDKFTKITE